jgi:hypothetical protein
MRISTDPAAYDFENNPSLHSQTHHFCYDMSCRNCHQNPDFIADLSDQVQDGLLTPQEADNIYRRRNI